MASPSDDDRHGAMTFGQTMILERNFSHHQLRRPTSFVRSNNSSERSPLLRPQSTGDFSTQSSTIGYDLDSPRPPHIISNINNNKNTIRFQVVVWSIGQVDVVQGRVPATFRITVFWNDDSNDLVDNDGGESVNTSLSRSSWKMQGRQSAVQQELPSTLGQTVDVPPISILNVVTFDTIGAPEVTLLREDVKLWRWSCMYRAILIQDHWRLDQYPHDSHDICLKIAVLAHRKGGGRWDRNIWKLGLATEQDSQGSTRVPYGLVVDHVNVPEFHYNKAKGLDFKIGPLSYGQNIHVGSSKDQCLLVKLHVQRDSSYYDRNIVPLLGLLNFVAISITALGAHQFFERGLLTLNIAFVEIGIRMTTDKHLPSVSYQIKIQRILNEYFYCLLLLVLESNLVYEMDRAGKQWAKGTWYIDLLAAVSVFSHNAWTLGWYYYDANRVRQKILNSRPKPRHELDCVSV